MNYFRAGLRLFPALLLAFTLIGCDSGGNGGGGDGGGGNDAEALNGTLTYEVTGAEEEFVGVSEAFYYVSDGSPQCLGSRSNSVTLPVEGEPLEIETTPPGCSSNVDADDFDGVEVTVPEPSSDASLTVRILSDGDIVAETSEVTNVEDSDTDVYEVSIGETFDVEDFL